MTLDDLKSLPVEALSYMDRCWLLLREEFLPKKTLHLLACDFAEAALKRERKAGREPDPRSWEAIRIKRLWVDGKATDDELEAALKAAWAAAQVAALAASREAGTLVQATAWAAVGKAERVAWGAVRKEQYKMILDAITSVDRDEAQELTGTEA
jgi:hypothetical protein